MVKKINDLLFILVGASIAMNYLSMSNTFSTMGEIEEMMFMNDVIFCDDDYDKTKTNNTENEERRKTKI